MRLLISLSKMYPKKLVNNIKSLLNYGGIKKKAEEYLGLTLITSIILTAITLLIYGINTISIIIALAVFFTTQGIFIIYPHFKSEQRARKVEKYLPDFLNLMASNVRSGMAPLTSMMNSAKEDFDVLSEEVQNAISASMGSESYETILNILTRKIKSVILERTVKLLITGMKTGGNISGLLEGAAEEVTQMAVLKKELIISVRSYMIFIMLVIVVGLPFLLTVSTYFVQTVQNLQTMITPSEVTPQVYQSTITTEYLNILSYIVITATSLFGALLVGSVIDSSFIQGLKYFIPLLALSIIIYIISSNLLPNMISTINI